MSMHFSANQYEDAFRAKRLKNWTVPRTYKERPSALDGYTQFIATDRGHLKDQVPRSAESPWGTFMGTWDMPRNIPPVGPSYTGRSKQAAENLRSFKEASPLNNAVNGYKPFKTNLAIKPSPYERPKAPTPVTSSRSPVVKPSSDDNIAPSPSSSPRRSVSPPSNEPTPIPRDSPVASKPTTPIRMMDQGATMWPKPTTKTDGDRQTPDSGRGSSPDSCCRSPLSLQDAIES